MKRRDVSYLEIYFEQQQHTISHPMELETIGRCMAIIRREKEILQKRAQRTREFFRCQSADSNL